MAEAYIVGAVRTPVGKKKGGLSTVHPTDLAAHTLKALIDRTGVDPSAVEDVIMGCVMQFGPQSMDIARNAWLSAGSAGKRGRCDHRPPVRLLPAVDPLRGPGRALRHPGPRRGRRGGVHEHRADGLLDQRRDGEGHALPVRRRMGGAVRQAGDLPVPGRRAHVREVGSGARGAGAIRLREPPAGGQGHRERLLQGPDRPAQRRRGRRGPAPGQHAGEAGVAEDAAGGRPHHGRHLLADLRRLRRAPDRLRAGGPRPQPDPPRPHRHPGAHRRRPGLHADRADPGDAEGAARGPACRSTTSTSPRSTRRSPRSRWRGSRTSAPTRPRSTRTAARSPWATRWAEPARS